MLGAIDLAAQLVLLAIDLRALGLGQVSVVVLPVVADFAIQPRFPGLQPRRLARREAARFDALRNAVLLVLAPLVDRRGIHAGRCQGGPEDRRRANSAEAFHCCFLLLTV